MVNKRTDDMEQSEDKIIKELKNAIKDNIEILKSDKKNHVIKSDIIPKEIGINNQDFNESNNKRNPSYLDNFRNIPHLSPEIKKRINIDKSNLLVSLINHIDNVNLEIIYLYLSIFKMIDGDLPATISLIQSFAERQSNNALFINQHNQIPDLISNFYGMAFLLETNQLNNSKIINIGKLKNFLSEELKYFNPTKLCTNYYLFNCINLLKKVNSEININTKDLIDKLHKIQIDEKEHVDFISNLYELIVIVKLIDNNNNLISFKDKYYNILKKTIKKIDFNELNISQCAKILLIIDLFGLKDEESKLVKTLLEKIFNVTKFFESEIENENFSWKTDTIAYLIELRMLYWALLSSQCTI